MFTCPQHGKIIGKKGGKPNYCPVCGNTVYKITLFPLFRFYIDKEWMKGVLSTILTIAVIIGVLSLAVWGISGCRERNKQQEAAKLVHKNEVREASKSTVDKMPALWAAVYYTAEPMGFDADYYKRQAILDATKKDEIKKVRKLKIEEAKVLLDLISDDNYRKEVLEALTPYIETDKKD